MTQPSRGLVAGREPASVKRARSAPHEFRRFQFTLQRVAPKKVKLRRGLARLGKQPPWGSAGGRGRHPLDEIDDGQQGERGSVIKQPVSLLQRSSVTVKRTLLETGPIPTHPCPQTYRDDVGEVSLDVSGPGTMLRCTGKPGVVGVGCGRRLWNSTICTDRNYVHPPARADLRTLLPDRSES